MPTLIPGMGGLPATPPTIQPVVTRDSVGTGGQNNAASNSTSTTWTHTATGGSQCVVVAILDLACSVSNNPGYFVTCTYGGVAMSPQGCLYYNSTTGSVLWAFVLANPPSGSQTVSVNAALSSSGLLAVSGNTFSYNAVNYYFGPATTLPHAAATSASMNVSSASGHQIVQAFFGSASSGSWSAYNQNMLWSIAGSSNYLDTVAGDATGAGTVTFSATGPSSQSWGGFAIDLSPQLPASPSGTVQYDATGTGYGSGTTAASLVATWSHTSSPNANAVVVMGSAAFSGTSPGTVTITATYGGVTMTSLKTQIFSGSTFSQMYMFGLINPPTGTQTVSVTVTCGSSSTIGLNGNSVSYTGVTSFGTAASNTASSASLSLSVSSASSQMVAQAFATNNLASSGDITAYNQSFRYTRTVTSTSFALIVGDAPGASTVSFSGTTTSAPWASVGVPLIP